MTRMYITGGLSAAIGFVMVCLPATGGGDKKSDLPILVQEDFEKGADRWQPTDPAAWKIMKTDTGAVYNQFKKRSKYEPPYRSPYNISLLKTPKVKSFQLDAKVKSTIPDYGHRDVCLFFGYQDAGHFYYVHFGKKMDDHANQIFIVNGKARTKISTKTTPGTNWDDKWHHLRVVRNADTGDIKVYYDDMKTPVMTATDRTFLSGQVGLGSFDDTAIWDNVTLRGVAVK